MAWHMSTRTKGNQLLGNLPQKELRKSKEEAERKVVEGQKRSETALSQQHMVYDHHKTETDQTSFCCSEQLLGSFSS